MAAGAILVIALAVFLGSCIQSVVGIGVGLLIAPATAGLAPDLMPALPLFMTLLVSPLSVRGEWSHVNWHAIGWSLPARVPGTVVGVCLVALFSADQLGVAVGLVVLAVCALTLRTLVMPVNRGSLVGAGFVSGVTGTTTSIGGPPLALLLQHRPPSETRATLSVFFFVGVVLSLVGLAVTGQVGRDAVMVALLVGPAAVLGVVAGWVLRDRVPREVFRSVVISVCAASAVLLLAKSLVS